MQSPLLRDALALTLPATVLAHATRQVGELVAVDLCEQVHPDLLLATDPDADRVGVAVKNGDDYLLLTGNEMGVLLLDYICKTRAARGEDLTKVSSSSAQPPAQGLQHPKTRPSTPALTARPRSISIMRSSSWL